MTNSTDAYFIITSGEDGLGIEGPLTAAEVEARITPDEHGSTYYGSDASFASTIPKIDKGCFMAPEGTTVILRGTIVVPKPVQRVTKYTL